MVLDADIGDCALRLYAVLLRYGNTTGARMPARTTLAARLHKKSVDTIDRALAEPVALGAVQVEPRWAGRQRLTNRYRIRTSRPGNPGPAPGGAHKPGSTGAGRTNAAPPQQPSQPGRKDAARGGRTDRGRVTARIGRSGLEGHPAAEVPAGRRVLPVCFSPGCLRLCQQLRALPQLPRRTQLATDPGRQRVDAESLARDASAAGSPKANDTDSSSPDSTP